MIKIRKKALLILIPMILIPNTRVLSVIEEIPNYELYRHFKIIMPAYHNETVVLNDYINTSLFDVDDYSLEFSYFTSNATNTFLLNNVEIFWLYQCIRYIDANVLSSYVKFKYRTGIPLNANISVSTNTFETVTTKRLYNHYNHTITIFFDVAIIHDFNEVISEEEENHKPILIVLSIVIAFGFGSTFTTFLINKIKRRSIAEAERSA